MTIRALVLSLCLTSAAALTARAQPPDTAVTPAPGQPAPTMVTPAQAPRLAIQPPTQAPRVVTPAPAGTPQAAPPAPRERREGQAVNIRVDVTITDQRGGGAAAAKKTVSVVAADASGGFIRSQANYINLGEVPLNVDVEPSLMTGPADGKIRLRVNLQYELPALPTAGPADVAPQVGSLRKTSIHENLSLILENGKAIVAAQSADPVGDRQVTIEVKATILK